MNSHVIIIYWAAPVFTQAERIWNRLCKEALEKLGPYLVALPQDRAKNFTNSSGELDFDPLVEDCENQAVTSDIVVVVLDGPDTDSGASVEYGMARQARRCTVGVRTDTRKSEDGHTNAMFRKLTKRIYSPSFNESVTELCQKIHETIQEVLKNN